MKIGTRSWKEKQKKTKLDMHAWLSHIRVQVQEHNSWFLSNLFMMYISSFWRVKLLLGPKHKHSSLAANPASD